jgi:pimeloyl-ACP methyl ester carboxylesterase
VRSTAEDPEGARSFLGGFDADRMFEMVLGSPAPADAELAADDGFRALYRRALEEGFAAGPDGYVGDTLLAMRPWELPLDRITVPVTICFGDQDASHSPDHGATLAARIPGARRIVVPGEGGLLLWTRTADVLASVTGAGEPVDRR